jgi:hypothetical protein
LVTAGRSQAKIPPPPGNAEYRKAHGMPLNEDDVLLKAASQLAWREEKE